MDNKTINYIPAEQLYPHPDNPRKELGDLTELTESIKAKGILQNLTVIKGHTENGVHSDDGYTVLIGHRRMAAAKLAGLTELPCVITEMDLKDQVATMLLENIQRSELTVYEQAKGFQMMLELGDTVENISEKTGFSQTTVRRRVKLLELDEEKFKRSEARGATLFDYMELDKIKDIRIRNRVLDLIGTDQFSYELKKAMEKEKNIEYINAVEAKLAEFATKIDDTVEGTYLYVRIYNPWNNQKVAVPSDADTEEYFYKIQGFNAYLYKKGKEPDEIDREEKEQAEREAKRLQRLQGLRTASAAAYEARKEAIENISEAHIIRNISVLVK